MKRNFTLSPSVFPLIFFLLLGIFSEPCSAENPVLERAFANERLNADDSQEILEVLNRLVDSSDPLIRGAALREIQTAAHLDDSLKRNGFSFVPNQIDELLSAYEKIATAWKSGEISAASLVDLKKSYALGKLLYSVYSAVTKVMPEGSVTGFGSSILYTAQEATSGPLAVVGAARILAQVYRNHLGEHAAPVVEDFFNRPLVPVFAADFHHYGFAEQLGWILAIRLLEKIPNAPDSLRLTIEALWCTSFLTTCRQMAGLRLAKESGTLIQALNQTWARNLEQLHDFEQQMESALQALGIAHDREPFAPGIAEILKSFELVVLEMGNPSLSNSYGMLARAESMIAETRAKPLFLKQLTDYLLEVSGHNPQTRTWGSFGVRAATGTLKTFGVLCSLPARGCAFAASIPIATLRGTHNIWRATRGIFHNPSSEMMTEMRCDDILVEIRLLQRNLR